jgi:WD40 repeat protein
LILAVGVTGGLFGLMMSRDAAVARAREAQARSAAAEAARRESQYQSLVLRLQQIRLLPHASGWSERAWDLVRQAAAIRADAPLRDQAAATLAGIDARLVRDLKGVGTSSLAFDREGKRLLIGGLEPDEHRDGRASILDLTSDRPPATCGLPGPGPVLFRDDATPLQLTARPEGGLVLWDLDRRRAIARVDVPGSAMSEPLALSQDGRSLAASVRATDGQDRVMVWDVEPRRLRHQLTGKATALSFSDDGELLAGGDEGGRIRVWSLLSGQRVFDRSQGRNTIHCFSFTRNPRRDPDGHQGWLLAAGDAGGSIVVWDLAMQMPVSRCHGSEFNVYALAFSPDGTTLASAGRSGETTILWDWATARMLLTCSSNLSQFSGLAFSRDGRRLATGHQFLHDPVFSHVLILDLDTGRGIRVLRGLTSPVGQMLFSPDGKRMAALSHDWQIAVWDLTSGHLDAILDAPKGYTTQDAGLAFSGDSREIAACAGREAKLWDLGSGKTLRSWPLPPGLLDQLAFCTSGHLIAFRCETLDGKNVPIDNDFTLFPRVGRIRDLLGSEPLGPIVEFRGFNRRVFGAVAHPEGRIFVVAGWHDGPDGRYRGIKALDWMTGGELWSMRYGTLDEQHESLVIEGAGDLATVRSWDGSKTRVSLLDITTGKELCRLDRPQGVHSPDWRYAVRAASGWQGISLHDRDDRLLVTLGIDRKMASAIIRPFSSDGRRLAWGNADGSVMVADLEEIRARLGRVGLSW